MSLGQHTINYKFLPSSCNIIKSWFAEQCIWKTRKHSSRMRTVRCSGRLLGVSLPRGGLLPRRGLCPGKGCVCSGGYIPACTEADTPLWTEWLTDRCKKHYLSATSFADGNNWGICLKCFKLSKMRKFERLACSILVLILIIFAIMQGFFRREISVLKNEKKNPTDTWLLFHRKTLSTTAHFPQNENVGMRFSE